jgi:N-acyl homoserine lactone hydrolase
MKKHLLIFMVSLIGGCSTHVATDSVPNVMLGLYVFDCGKARFESIAVFSVPDDETDVRDIVMPCYVIEHEKGRLLWDGGLASSTADIEGWHGEGLQFRLDRTLAEQLTDVGLDMGSFDYVAFSHLHSDHVGVANELNGARLIIQKPEFDAGFADPVTMPGFDRSLYGNLENSEPLIIEGDHDVFGDGRVRIISAPGHTIGHQVLYIDLANYGPIVLSGDLYHFAVSRQKRYVPTFNFNVDDTLASMDRVEAFLVETGAELWIEHELARFEQLNKSPFLYD